MGLSGEGCVACCWRERRRRHGDERREFVKQTFFQLFIWCLVEFHKLGCVYFARTLRKLLLKLFNVMILVIKFAAICDILFNKWRYELCVGCLSAVQQLNAFKLITFLR